MDIQTKTDGPKHESPDIYSAIQIASISKQLTAINNKTSLIKTEIDIQKAELDGYTTYLKTHDENLTFDSRASIQDKELVAMAKLHGLHAYLESYIEEAETLNQELSSINPTVAS